MRACRRRLTGLKKLNDTNLFGRGWATPYDVFVRFFDSRRVLLKLPDGRAIFFNRPTISGPFVPETQCRRLLLPGAIPQEPFVP